MTRLSQFLHDHSETLKLITPICAVIVSSASIVLAFLALLLQRRHHFKSLTPVPNFLTGNYENQLAVKLRNMGVGPLLIEQFRVTNGTKIDDDIISFMPKAPNKMYWETYTYNIDGWCIAPNHEAIVIKLDGDLTDTRFQNFRDAVRIALSELTLTLKYKDIYDRSMPDKQKSLEGSFENPKAKPTADSAGKETWYDAKQQDRYTP